MSGASWTVLGESVAGTSHVKRDVPCQDAFRYERFGESLVIVVADGAGSASHAEFAATFACDAFVRKIPQLANGVLTNRDRIVELFGQVRAELFEASIHSGVPPRELACTLLLAVCGAEQAMFAQLGDGAIIMGNGQGYEPVFWPDASEYANATDFLTDDRYANRLLFRTTTNAVPEVALLSDGLQRLALDYGNCSAFAEFFAPLFQRLRHTEDVESLGEPFRQFLDSDRVNARTDDDKTLVLALRSE